MVFFFTRKSSSCAVLCRFDYKRFTDFLSVELHSNRPIIHDTKVNMGKKLSSSENRLALINKTEFTVLYCRKATKTGDFFIPLSGILVYLDGAF